ncbi:MAG: carboxylesterase family protein [Streptomyces sp.]|nr:carboxylesterase family protein [Streptomyces sp.]
MTGSDHRTVRTPGGVLRGVAAGPDGAVSAFRGVPYAVAGRFVAPHAAPGWEGARDAGRPGPAAPQPPSRLAPVTGPGGGLAQSEDCLSANVWTPDPGGADGGGLPVLVWLHGGGFSSGSGGEAFYDGALLAERGRMVVVTVNYRLGALGYVYVEPGSWPADLGLLDQLAALRWVRESAAAFGGDPDRVTLAGQSAGALSVLALLAHPAGRGLFAQAVLQSCPAGVRPHTPAEAADNGRRLAELAAHPAVGRPGEGAPRCGAVRESPGEVGREPPAHPAVGPPGEGAPRRGGLPESPGEVLRGLGLGELLDAQQALVRERAEPLSVTPPLQLVAAGGLPADLLAAARRDVPLLVGTARDEARAFFPDEPADIVADVTARRFTDGTLRLAAQATTACAYRFDWAPPGSPLGACHCIELPFVFGVGEEPAGGGDGGRESAWRAAPMLAGADPADLRRLTAVVQRAWSDFVHTGSPGWAPYPLVRSIA